VTVINKLCNAPTAASVIDFLNQASCVISHVWCALLKWLQLIICQHVGTLISICFPELHFKPKNCTILGYRHMCLQSLKHFLLIVLDVHGHNI
jgi:hypothetical protein